VLAQKGLENVYDLHVWAMSTTKTALTAHLIMPEDHRDIFIPNLTK
jgi:cobalt-zinc-cadmium efflux system protein